MPSQKELKDIVELYTGKKVKKLNLFPDPYSPPIIAIRSEFENGDIVDFLYDDSFPGDRDSLEDVEFEQWPPTYDKKNLSKLENMRFHIL